MLRSMYSGISGMKVNQTKLDVVGNNIANVSTTGFKSSQARFKDMLYQNAGYASAPTTAMGGTNAKQVGLGAQLSSINKMMGQGNAMSTGRSLDVCVDGDGYLVVSRGDVTSGVGEGATTAPEKTYFTRDGNLTLDKDGNLLTADGYRVMGYYLTGTSTGSNPTSANPSIKYDATTLMPTVSYVDADAKDLKATSKVMSPLAIPDEISIDGTNKEKVMTFEIGKDGIISAVLSSGKRSAIGQIAMATFKNPEGLTNVGGNLLLNSANSGEILFKEGVAKDATTGNDDKVTGFGDFIQGALEGSNVDITEQFTDMIVATRAFQASSKMISNGDEILQTITGLVR